MQSIEQFADRARVRGRGGFYPAVSCTFLEPWLYDP